MANTYDEVIELMMKL